MKKKLLYCVSFFLLLAFAIYIWIIKVSYIPSDLNKLDFEPILESAKISPSRFRFTIFDTAYSKTPEAFTFPSGSWSKTVELHHYAILVEHPLRTVLIDTGIGSQYLEQIKHHSWLSKAALNINLKKPAITQLNENNSTPLKVNDILLTHIHWDHSSGLIDFPDAQLYLAEEEISWLNHEKYTEARGIHPEHFEKHKNKIRTIPFQEKAYEGFKESWDMFNDGALVVVKLGGHTPGSIGIFLNFSSQERYFFVGDISWKINEERQLLYKSKVGRIFSDQNITETARKIHKINHLANANPYIKIIPAHDQKAYLGLKFWPEWNKKN